MWGLGVLFLFTVSALPVEHELWLQSQLFDADPSTQTTATVILKDGQLIYEAYDQDFHSESRLLTWSISKSVTASLVAMALEEGRLSLDDKVSKYFPHLEALDASPLSVRDLLYWSSGVDWNETYEDNPFDSTVIEMLFGSGKKRMAEFVLSRGFRFEPGARFSYSSGDTQVLMSILLKAVENLDYPFDRLFEPLGIQSATWQTDQAQDYVGASYLFMSAGDLARFGQWVLQRGVWDGNPLVSPAAFDRILFQPSAAFLNETRAQPVRRLTPGGQWWLNRDWNKLGVRRLWPDLPEDTVAGLGHWGQSLVIIPSKNLVFVRFGNDRSGWFDHNAVLSELIKRLEGESK